MVATGFQLKILMVTKLKLLAERVKLMIRENK